ncbi:MAG TPA: DUF1844 domain-containing protein [Thermoanaerobaculia bacterium]
MPNEKQPKELKVTDKRIFTPDGDIREEFQKEIRPAEPQAQQQPKAAEPPPEPREDPRPEPRAERRQHDEPRAPGEDRRRTIADKATNPGTPFTNFIEPLIAQGYMSLGMLRNPYQPQSKIDTAAARQMIEILTLLREKTRNNLEPDEEEFLETHLGELKLAFVQRTKTI